MVAIADANDIESIVSCLEEDMVFSVLPPQARLIEGPLMERFDVKRHTIREAFRQLEEMGLITRVPNKGAIVNELVPKEVHDIYFMRELLESTASRITHLPADRRVVAEMERIQKRHSKAVVTEDFRAVFRLNIQFHATQYSACDNVELRTSIAEFARKAHLVRAVMYGDAQHLQRVQDQHRAIIEALRGDDNDRLVEIVRAHIWPSSEEYARLYRIRHGGAPGRS